MDKKRLILAIVIVVVEIIVMAVVIRLFVNKKNNDELFQNADVTYDDTMWKDDTSLLPNGNETYTTEKEENVMNIIINNEAYIIMPENTELMNEVLEVLPESFVMNELNGNEKYYYLSSAMKNINPQLVGQIQKGDVMLFGSDCLVIFYDSFETEFRYTKIGHIDNLGDLESGNVDVSITK